MLVRVGVGFGVGVGVGFGHTNEPSFIVRRGVFFGTGEETETETGARGVCSGKAKNASNLLIATRHSGPFSVALLS